MKIASKTRLSLRKLFTAMLAVGPLAVLPSPVWAVLPTSSSFTVTSGTASLTSASATSVNINFTDKAILSWGVTTNAAGRGAGGAAIADGTTLTNFIVDTGDTWNFASTGSVLNKVMAGNNTTAGILGGAAQAAVINGQIIGSSAKVYVLANGGILIGAGSQLNTQSLVLSTISGENDGTFITLGDLTYAGSSTGNITINGMSAGGNVTAVAGAILPNVAPGIAGSVGGDLVLKSITAGQGIVLSGATALTVGGNLTVTTNNASITQGASALTVGVTPTGTQVATFNPGTGAVTLNNNANDFEKVVATTSGAAGSVTLRDANIVTLGASTIGGDLDVKVGGKTNTTAINTDGAVAVTGNVALVSTTSANSGISIANNSSVGGYVTAQTSGGNISLTTTGNLTLGNISTNVTATQMSGAAWTALAANAPTLSTTAATATPAITGGAVTSIAVTTAGSGYTSVPTVTLSAPPPGGTQATATATISGGVVTGYTITNPGAGYLVAPTATLTGGLTNGTLATLTPTAGWTAAASPIYTGNVTITISAPTAAATAPALAAGAVTVGAATVSNQGSGYTAAPVVTVVGGGGSGATAVATLGGPNGDQVTGVTITAGGTGYTTVPTIIIADPVAGAVKAEARGVRDGTTGLVTSIEITNAGFGYGASLPTIAMPTINTSNNFQAQGAITVNTTGVVTTDATKGVGVAGIKTSGGNAQVTLRGSSIVLGGVATVGGNSGVTLTSTAGPITIGGGMLTANRVTVNATGGDINLAAGGDITTNGRLEDANSFTVVGGNVVLDQISGVATALTLKADQRLNVTAPTASIRSSNNITLGTANVTGNLTLRAGSTVGAGGNKNITLGYGDGVTGSASAVVVGGWLNAYTDGTGWIRDNNDSRFDVYGGLDLKTGLNNGGALLAGGDITLDAATFPGALTPSVRLGQLWANTGAAGGAVTLAETTTLNLGNITASSLTASSATGSIIDTGIVTLAAGGTANLTVSGSNNVVLDSANTLPVINLNGGVDNSITALAATTKLESTTGATGTTTIGTNGTNSGLAIQLGNIVTTGNLVVNSGSYIDVVGNANITGNLTLTATGNVPNAAALGNVYAPTLTINTTTGRLTAIGASNLPVLSYSAAPTITVNGGSIAPAAPATVTGGVATLNAAAGNITGIALAGGGTGYAVAPTVLLSAPNLTSGVQATATATITGGIVTGFTITNAGSGYTAAPTVTLVGGSNPTTVATVTANLGSANQISGFNVTNSATNGGNTPYVTAANTPFSVDIAGATTTSISQSSGTLKVAGTTSIASPGNAILFRANDFTNVVLNNSTGGAIVNDVNNVSISGTSAGALEVRAGANGTGTTGTAVTGAPIAEANPWALVLGNLNVNSLVAVASNGGAGNSGTITQASGTRISSYGLSSFATSNNSITIGNSGNAFGRIEANTNAGTSITLTLVEDNTMKIGNISNRGTTNLTSATGSIIEDTLNDVVISNNGTLNATARAGSITIGNTTHTAGNTTANIVTFNGVAPTGTIAITSNNSTTLAGVDANSLTVNVTGGNGNITQSGALKVFGTTTFVTSNNINLGNNSNSFGRLFLTTSGTASNITLTEGATMNLGRVTMAAGATGNFTATSVAGDIIDTGLGGVRPGGVVGTTGTGLVTLAAAAGNITLDDPTTDFPTTGGVVFSAVNVALSPLGATNLYLGAAGQTAVATGNLSVTSATGSIYNAGPVNVTGDAFFQSGNGDILMTNSGNNFGTVKFAGKIVSITEAGNLSLVTGSSATGAATFTTSGGNIDIVNKGGTISLASTALFNASGSITLPKLIQVSDTLTVSAAGTKDLSKLTVSGDLGSKNPLNFGTGSYLPPLP